MDHAKYRPVGWLDVPDIPEDAPLPSDECGSGGGALV